MRAIRLKAILLFLFISAFSTGVMAESGLALLSSMPVQAAVIILMILSVFFFFRGLYFPAWKAKADIVQSDGFSQSLIDISPDAIVIVCEDLKIEKFNPAAEKMFGYQHNDIVEKSFVGTLISTKEKPTLDKFLEYFKNKNDASLHSIQLDFLNKNGFVMTTTTRLAVVRNEGHYQYILHIQDNSKQIEAEGKLHYATYNDELTGLSNRYMLSQHIYQGISDAKRRNRNLVVMQIGLDRFKDINESLGHRAGDSLLVKIAELLQGMSRRGDIVSRVSGDQFVVTLVDVDRKTNLDALVRKYVDSFNQPFNVDEHVLHISVSIGIACYPDDAFNVDSLLRNCESAMFQAKQKGGTGFRYYSREMRKISKERLYLENELRRAIEKNELDVYYQPQVDLSTGKIIGVEALVRWTHPTLGQVSPVKFIPVAEEIGLISEIGEWVMRRACTDMALMARNRGESLRLSINLSAHQFHEDDLIRVIADALSETTFPPDMLELEITESLFMEDVDSVANTLKVLSRQGIRISMDDFGTGYSSLSYLKRFPINTIKVDRSFVKDITTDKDDASIVSATIQMAHSLSLDIVAEGVETEEQLQFLLNQKCDKIQGFYFSRPLSFKALVNLMDENRQIELDSGNICLISKYR